MACVCALPYPWGDGQIPKSNASIKIYNILIVYLYINYEHAL